MISIIPSIKEIRAAAKRIEHVSVHTPILESPQLNERIGARIFIKAEIFQRSGSFKFRGAYNRLSQLNAAERSAGVVAWSSGNHAQGIAAAAKLLNVSATIVMPHDAPSVKIERTRALGAEIVGYNRLNEDREEIGRELARSRGAVLVPSYDDIDIITGQATVGLELASSLGAEGVTLDNLLVCCGGGGLIAGVSSAFAHLSPQTKVYCVEPSGYDDHARSLRSGCREKNAMDKTTLCDALMADQPGKLTFEINKELLSGGLVVDDDEVIDAMRCAYSQLKIVLEPSGAVALAAALSGKCPTAGKNIGVVVSGANVDPALYAEIIAGS